jgi:hypothetical protein
MGKAAENDIAFPEDFLEIEFLKLEGGVFRKLGQKKPEVRRFVTPRGEGCDPHFRVS